jgi:hypothetical protein
LHNFVEQLIGEYDLQEFVLGENQFTSVALVGEIISILMERAVNRMSRAERRTFFQAPLTRDDATGLAGEMC